MSDEKSKALAAALAQIQKNFGKGSIMKMDGSQQEENLDVISTGSLGVDLALGVGGLPRGRVVEIFGPESSGKTTLCLEAIAQCQKNGGICAFIDAEHAFDPIYARKLGVKVEELYTKLPNNSAVSAIWKFYQKNPAENLLKVQADPLWPEIEKNLNKKYSTFSFLLEGETTIVAAQKDVINADEEKEGNEKEQLCLITGNQGKAVDVTTATMIAGSQATAKLVAFQVNSGYDSYGKQKGFNAPISQKAEFAYTTALNHILSANSRNKFLVGNRTYLFWGSSNSNGNQETESSIFAMFGFNDSEEEDPNARIYQIRKVFEGIYSGSIKTDLNDRFYIAGLAPNAARIAIVYWAELSLKDFAHTILRHFEDMDIVNTRKEKKPY